MCLIIFKPSGESIPENYLVNGFKDNPDGWGILSFNNGEFVTIKGLTLEGLISSVKTINKNSVSVVHMRFGTHGTEDLDNCHPYQVTEDIWIMHNGIIRNMPETDKTKSDTWHFANIILKPMLNQRPELFCSDELDEIISAIAPGSKFVLFNSKDGRAQIIGEKLGCVRKGLWLSNEYSITDYVLGIPTNLVKKSYIGDESEFYMDEGYFDGSGRFTKWNKRARHPESLDDLFEMGYDELEDYCIENPEEVASILYYGEIVYEQYDEDEIKRKAFVNAAKEIPQKGDYPCRKD